MVRTNKNLNVFKWLFILVLGILIGLPIGRYSVSPPSTKVEVTVHKDSVVTKKDTLYVIKRPKPSLNDKNLLAELKKEHIKHPEIVLAQAKLETGHYTSEVLKTHNNLFGLMKGDHYRRFNHWTESVKAYKKLVQDKYKGGNYYAFLNKLGYAEDPTYTDKLNCFI